MTDNEAKARVAARLKELRLAAKLGGQEAGRQADMSQSKISKLERGVLRPTPEDVAALCEIYGASSDERDELVRLTETFRAGIIEPARVTLSRGAPAMQHRIARLEESATLLRSFQNTMVIGLLQTPAYASVVFGSAVTGEEVSAAVTARMERQEQLRRQVPRAVLIMTEGALRWQLGSPSLMVKQIEAIIAAIDLPNVEIGIIPFETAADFYCRHGFHLYDSDAVIVGTESGTATITDGEDVRKYEKLFSRLTSLAATGENARRILERIADDYRRLG